MADSDFGMGYALGADSSNGGGSGFGGNGDWFWALILLAMLGFGGRGFGGGIMDNGSGQGFGGMVAPWATQADVRAAVDQQTLISKLDQQTYGLADSTYALNNAITNGFHGVDNAICNLGFNVQTGFNSLGTQMAKCCCDIERGLDGVNYNMATHFCNLSNTIQSTTRDIIENQNAGTREILNFLTQDKIASLTAENQSLKFAASQAQQNAFITANQEAQTAELIRRLGVGCPTPAYLVQPPTPVNFPTNGCGTVQFGNWGQRECGCGC